MKKFSLWALLLMFSIIGLQSCKEDLVADEGQDLTSQGVTARKGAPQAISKVFYKDRFGNKQEILNFATKEDYRNTLDRLEQKYDANSDLEDEYRVLLNFDKEYNFSSLLNDYISAETTWLMTEDLPDATDPDNNFYGLDEEELALLNKDRAVMIDGKILVYFQDGYSLITNGDFSILNQMLQFDSLSIIQSSRGGWGWIIWILIVIDDWGHDNNLNNDDNGCRVTRYKRNRINIGNRKYVVNRKYRTANELAGFWAKTKLKMKAYKKRRWFGWKKVKANMKIELNGVCSLKNCGDLEKVYDHDYREGYVKKLKHSWRSGTNQFFMEDEKLFANFYVDNNLIKHTDLYNGD